MTKDEALKMAMKDHEEIMMHAGILYPREFGKSFLKTYEAMKAALEQPAQEPLTRAQQVIRANNSAQPLYTHPNQWQGLTDNEKLSSIRKWAENNTMRGQELIGLCDSIEQALKEKNT
jgi:hypothetical protein